MRDELFLKQSNKTFKNQPLNEKQKAFKFTCNRIPKNSFLMKKCGVYFDLITETSGVFE